MKITIDDVIEFIIKNSENRERMDKINKITFPFTSKYENFSSKKSKKDIRIGGSGYQPSYEDMREIVEAPIWTFPWDDLLVKQKSRWGVQ